MASASKEMRASNLADRLTDDIILQILSRLPVKSICRFKCVSRAWRDLISHPNNRKNLPQTLSGFFYQTYSSERFPEYTRHLTNVTGRGQPLVRPSLSFLPNYGDVTILDCCNGMLLCRRRAAGPVRYVVCNPATEEWAELPESSGPAFGVIFTARLGFDPDVSPHFHVFEFLEKGVAPGTWYTYVDGLEIYSSNTMEWAHRDSGWRNDAITLSSDMFSVFFEGFLHVFSDQHSYVLVVDTEGKISRTIEVPEGKDFGFIGQSQGRLYYINTDEEHDYELSVYVLEDYATDEWTFKHSVRTSMLLGKPALSIQQYDLVAIHPECNRIFFTSDIDNTLRCYDMDRRKVHVICNIGSQCHLEKHSRCYLMCPNSQSH